MSVSITVPDTTKYQMAPSVTELLRKVLDGRCARMMQGRTSVTLAFVAADPSPAGALQEVAELLPELTNVLGVDAHAAFDVRLALGEDTYPRSELADDGGVPTDENYGIVGVGEAADLLGVSKQRIHQLARAHDFPEPVTRLRATPIWKRSDIEVYAARRNTKAGPALSLV